MFVHHILFIAFILTLSFQWSYGFVYGKRATEECSNGLQKDYIGTKSTTRDNLPCQRWDTQWPQGHSRTAKNYPDSNLEHNYCRNPDNEPEGAWCYTTTSKRWDYCGIPQCGLHVSTSRPKSTCEADPVTLSSTQIEKILAMHNEERSLTKGSSQMVMVWDDDLAKLARTRSDSCEFEHADLELNGKRVGQNLAYSSYLDQGIENLVQLWINEKDHYDLKTQKCSKEPCGHYTQMVWSETTKVGCGLTKCPCMGAYIACDYYLPGNVQGQKEVNLDGEPCSNCNMYPGTKCTNGLCETCDPDKTEGCRPYDSSKCFDADKDCGWKIQYCNQDKYRSWLEGKCMKSCGFCHS